MSREENGLNVGAALDSLFNTLPNFVALIDLDGTILTINDTAAYQLGERPDELIGLNAFELLLLSTNIILVMPSQAHQVIQTREPVLFEIEAFDDQIYDSLYPIYDNNQDIVQIALLKRSGVRSGYPEKSGFTDQFRTLVENVPDIISRFDKDLRHIYISPPVTKATGLAPTIFIGRSNRDLGLPERSVKLWEESLFKVFETGEVDVIEYDVMTPSGRRYYEAQHVPEFDEEGDVKSVLSIARDITEHKKTEEALRVSESRYRRLIDTAQEGVWILDDELKTVFVNQCLSEMLGCTAKQILGKSPFDFMDKMDVREARGFFKQKNLIKGEHYFRFRRNDGTDLWTVVSINPIFDERSRMTGILGMVTDITRLKEAEASLRQINAELETKIMERTSQLHQLLSQIITIQENERRRISEDLHDEVGQTMTSLILKLNLVKQSIPSQLDSIKQSMEDSIQIAVRTMDQLRQIAHLLHPPALHTLSLSKVIEDLCNSYTRAAHLDVNFTCRTELPILPEIYAISLYRLAQESLTNIVKHAEARSVWMTLDCDDGVISLSVEDDGKGFKREVVVKGIGLQGLQERFYLLDGSLDIESYPNGGTRLTGYLPIKNHQEEKE
jgi:PAS domain S-box-containing protein